MTLNFTRFFGHPPEALYALVAPLGGVHADLFLEESRTGLVRRERGQVVVATVDRARGGAIRSLSDHGGQHLLTDTNLGLATWASLAEALPRAPGGRTAALTTTSHGAPFERAPELLRLLTLAEQAERVARGLSTEIREVQVSLRDAQRHTAIASRDGVVVDGWSERASVAVEVVTERGTLRETGFESAGGAGIQLDEALVEATARRAATRALAMLEARPAEGGPMPVILAAEAGGTFVHEAVGHALEGDCVLEGLSVFEGREGERIAHPGITVVDDATWPGGHGSYPVDDEGVPGGRTVLVEAGVLVGFLHDRRSAHLLGARPSGKGRRESFRDRPVVRMSNTLILPGQDDPAAILKDTPRGLYVVRMGGGEVDTLTGDFVFEVNEAYRIEAGHLGDRVKGATLTGSAPQVLMAIDRVGTDLGLGLGWCGKDGQDVPISDGEPTLRIPSLVVGA